MTIEQLENKIGNDYQIIREWIGEKTGWISLNDVVNYNEKTSCAHEFENIEVKLLLGDDIDEIVEVRYKSLHNTKDLFSLTNKVYKLQQTLQLGQRVVYILDSLEVTDKRHSKNSQHFIDFDTREFDNLDEDYIKIFIADYLMKWFK